MYFLDVSAQVVRVGVAPTSLIGGFDERLTNIVYQTIVGSETGSLQGIYYEIVLEY